MDTSITIQNIDNETIRELHEEAKQQGVTIDTLVLQLIREGIELKKRNYGQQVYHDLDALAATWTNEENAEFLNSLSDFERVDNVLWQ